MALFRRKRQDPSVLPEIDEYYEGERRDRAGVAWLLAIISVVIVAIFIIILFFATRWAFRQISGKNDTNEVSIGNQSGSDKLPSFDGGAESSNPEAGDESTNSDKSKDSDKNVATDDQDVNKEGRVDAPAHTETPSNPSSPTTPIPSTGPEHTLALFIAVSIIAGSAHYILSERKS